MVMTVFVHAGGMSLGLRYLMKFSPERLERTSVVTRSLLVGVLILIMFAATLIEAGLWAAAYCVLGAISEIEEALYFSTVTYTTLGFGDIVLEERWRLLSSFEAANGIIAFGWTTALLVITIRHVSQSLRKLHASS